MKLVFASNNKGKIRELKNMLEPIGYEILSLNDIGFTEDIVEDGTSFLENALIKARTVSEFIDCPIIADDSGLCCDGLDGGPGIYTHRFGNKNSDSERNEYLIECLKDKDKKCHYACVIVLYYKGKYESFEGTCDGIIIDNPRGDNGFGHDPIFYLESYGLTMAEISLEEKNKISHRAIATKKLKEVLKDGFTY